jgi:hypothetical protein
LLKDAVRHSVRSTSRNAQLSVGSSGENRGARAAQTARRGQITR